MSKLSLTQGKYALVDSEVFEDVFCHKWHASRSRDRYYAARSITKPDGNKTSLYLHTYLFGKAKPRYQAHFKNGNSLDCRSENFEFIKRSAKAQRYNKQSERKKCKYLGVTFKGDSVRNKPYVSRLKYRDINMTIGHYETEIEAANAYDKIATLVLGKGIKRNFPVNKQ